VHLAAFDSPLLNQQRSGHQHDGDHRQAALQHGVTAHFADEQAVGLHREQRHPAAQHGGQREVADHQREDHQGVDQHSRCQRGQQHAPARGRGRGAQAQAGFFQLPVEAAQCRQNTQVDVRVVDQGHRENQARPAIEAGHGQAQVAQEVADQAVVAQDHQPRLADDDLGNHDGGHRQHGQPALEWKVVPRHHIGQRHAQGHGACGDNSAQQHGVDDGLQVFRRGQHLGKAVERKAAIGALQAVEREHADGQHHEQRQHRQAQQRQQAPGPGQPARQVLHAATTRLPGFTHTCTVSPVA
jgi:hypothetical protein